MGTQGINPNRTHAFRALPGALLMCMSLFSPAPLDAQVPEPETIFYGRIINRTSGQEYQLREGVVSWSISSGDTTPVAVTAPIGALQDGKYSYVLKVPHQAKSLDLNVAAGSLPLRPSEVEFDTSNILVNGKPASPVGGPLRFVASQPKRGGVYRLDLEVFNPLEDSDGDGIPDWWEDLYGLDKQWAGDARLRAGDNRYTNFEAFRLGIDPRVDDRVPQLLTKELSVVSDGATGLLLRAVASATPPAQLVYQLTAIPAGGSVVLSNSRPDPKMPSRELKAGDSFTQADVESGRVNFVHSDPAVRASSLKLQVTALNRPNDVVTGEVALSVYRPQPADGRAGARWAATAVASGLPEKGSALDVWKKRATSAFSEEWVSADAQRNDIASFLLSRWFEFIVWDGREELPARNLRVPSAGLAPAEYATYLRTYGRARNHVIFAGNGSVRVEGGMSSDILIAGAGSPTLRGNLGPDMFVAGEGQVVIEDFKPGERDVLDLSELLHGVPGALEERVQVTANGNDTRLEIPLGDGTAVIILRDVPIATVNLEKWRRAGAIFTGDLNNVAAPENRAPEAVADKGYVVPGEPITLALLSNDRDLDGDALTIESVTPGLAGSTEFVGDTVIYTPGPGFAGADRFTYTISDGRGGVAVGDVVIAYPFPAAAGTYTSVALSATGEPVGQMTVSLLSTGAFTVKLNLRGILFTGRGEFDSNGAAEVELRAGSRSVTARLSIDLSDPKYPLTGDITGADGTESLTEAVAATSPKALLPAALKFTAALHMPPGESPAHGFAAVSLGRNSAARIVGQLVDGTRFSVGAAQRRDGTISWATPLYKGKGWLLGLWTTGDAPGASLGGSTRWTRTLPETSFDRTLPTDISLYVAPSVPTVSILDFSDSLAKQADLVLREGGLSTPVHVAVAFLKSDVIQKQPGSSLRLTVNRASGVFTGSLQAADQTTPIKGAILQSKNLGYGFFLNNLEAGSVELLPK